MTFVLCRHCLGWAEPIQHRCALCAEPMDLSDADPALGVLTERMGLLEERLGAVQLLRNELPQIGHWYRATKGFLFLPHELRNVVDEETNWKPQSSAGDWWSLIKSMIPQTALIDWLAHCFNENYWNDALLTPPEIDRQAPQLLARLLMRHPGVLFLEQTTINQYRNRKRNWTLYRAPAGAIHFRVLGEWRDFQERMESTLKFTHHGSAPGVML